MPNQTAVIVHSSHLPAAMEGAIAMWADGTTSADSRRRLDLVRDKTRMVKSFFEWTGKPLKMITEIDVKTWQAELEARGLSPSSVYGHISRLSSWYNWALGDATVRENVSRNPVTMARPKAPKPYQSEKTKALSEDELRALLAVVKTKAASGDLVGLRDYAILLSFALTGYRRAEVLRWRGADVRLNGKMQVTTRLKGGDKDTRQINSLVRDAVRAYLLASGRDPENLDPAGAIWLAHDRAHAGAALSSHGFAKNLKAYAKAAGLGDWVHVHSLRHTYAGMVYEATGGDVGAAQYELGHKNQQTTRLYVHTVAVRKDRYSGMVATALGLEED